MALTQCLLGLNSHQAAIIPAEVHDLRYRAAIKNSGDSSKVKGWIALSIKPMRNIGFF